MCVGFDMCGRRFAPWSVLPSLCAPGFFFSPRLSAPSCHFFSFSLTFLLDIDECVTLTQPCSPGFNCINTAGSFMCQRKIMCSRGYHASPDRSTCVGTTRREDDFSPVQSWVYDCDGVPLLPPLPPPLSCRCGRVSK